MTWYFYNNKGVLFEEQTVDPLPVGLVTAFVSDSGPTPTVPSGWLLCDGGSHASASYPELANILSFPAAPGVNFSVPNLSTRLPIGAGGSYAVRSTGGSSQHPHSIPNHTHSNTHRHGVTTTHSHGGNHRHDSNHIHGNGTYELDDETGPERHALDTGAGITTSAKGPGSGSSHNHNVTGSVGTPNTSSILNYRSDIDSSFSGSGNSNGIVTALNGAPAVISYPGDILPPYLNVYFIIKAVDTSGN